MKCQHGGTGRANGSAEDVAFALTMLCKVRWVCACFFCLEAAADNRFAGGKDGLVVDASERLEDADMVEDSDAESCVDVSSPKDTSRKVV